MGGGFAKNKQVMNGCLHLYVVHSSLFTVCVALSSL